ncbi:RpiB/LacA/LacB family sugar-phosphate isomerase (plasmid) [Entomospira nematocerorum]|uniref:Galactose-6-phosphate isomerase n=1 Tax=Entomospira nematocerorum TaxID=2719987 RepID=A0A968GH19_9SPIO|nr:RpiB/LacA/LacB family sugar-phosphate isomerase [Entomospira nematocera]NIZ47711.1 galactose-6-phosphate isomerase [Entomospira nematocera]WDI34684.1 RpiB/LacA/LacB family sugar-phosphate isomerase [Entomospira nematocera]
MVHIYALNLYKLYSQSISRLLHDHHIETQIHELDTDDPIQLSQGIMANSHVNNDLIIVIDADTIATFNMLNKSTSMVCAPGYDEHSAHMTRDHNGTQVIIIGAEVTTLSLAESIALKFVSTQYSGGRHQIRLDMMDRLIEEERDLS